MKDKKNFKLIVSTVLIVVLVLLAVFPGGELFQNKFSSKIMLDRQNIDGFYDLPKNSIDVYFSGSSQIISGISSPELYKQYGITAFGMGTCSQPVRAAYYYFKELLENQKQKPKVFLYEVSALTYKDKDKGSHARAFTDMKNTSKNKYEALKELTDGNFEQMLGYYWGMYKYHDRWSELSKDDYMFTQGVHEVSFGGFAITTGDDKNDNTRDDYIVSYVDDNKIEVEEEIYFDYLNKMKALCDENGITMLFIKTPIEDWTDEGYSGMKDLADSLGVEYLDFNHPEYFDELGLDLVNDFFDYKHLNVYGAEKVTAVLGEYLKENFDLEDKRGSSRYFEKLTKKYDEAVKTAKFGDVESFIECKDYLSDKKYSYVLSLKGDINFGEEEKELLKSMGVKTETEDMKNFVFVSHKGRAKKEHNSKGSVEIRGYTLSGDYYFGKIDADSISAKFADASRKVTKDNVMLLSVFDSSTGLKVCTLVFDSDLNVI